MIDEVDGWIATLMECRQLSEADIKKLCDKVRFFLPFFLFLLSCLLSDQCRAYFTDFSSPSLPRQTHFIFSCIGIDRFLEIGERGFAAGSERAARPVSRHRLW